MPQASRDALARRTDGTALVRRLTKLGGVAVVVAVGATAAVVAHSLPGRSAASASQTGGTAQSASVPLAPSAGGSSAGGSSAGGSSGSNGASSMPAVTSGGS
jgi:hypothetical protein